MSLVETATRPRTLMHRQDQVDRMVEAIRAGAHVNVAAAHAGFNGDTVMRWVDEGRSLRRIADINPERDPAPHEITLMRLAEQVDGALAEAERALTGVVWDAATRDDDVKAAQWLLERRFRERWAARTEVTGAAGGPVEIEDVGKQRAAVLEALQVIADKIEAAEEMVVGEVVAITGNSDEEASA